jgi:hypothetical protein
VLLGSRGDSLKPSSKANPGGSIGHLFNNEIDAVAKMELSGLSVDTEGEFEPERPVTRSDFISLISDLIARISGSRRVDRAFGEDFLDRELSRGDSDVISGADMLFVLKKMREKYPVFD